MPQHYAPASFDKNATEVKVFFERPAWSSGLRALRALNTHAVAVLVPLFWQMMPSIYDTCRIQQAPVFVGSAGNLPVAAAAVAGAQIDTVVLEALDIAAVAAAFEKIEAPRSWVVLHRPGAVQPLPEALLRSGVRVAQEVHALPGFVCLAQCETLMERKEPLFHLRTLPEDIALPPVQHAGLCACGETTYQSV